MATSRTKMLQLIFFIKRSQSMPFYTKLISDAFLEFWFRREAVCETCLRGPLWPPLEQK
jgi:hypothetical protein